MVCCLTRSRPLHEPMMSYRQWDSQEHDIPVNYYANSAINYHWFKFHPWIISCVTPSLGIPIIKIKWFHHHIIIIKGIPISGNTCLSLYMKLHQKHFKTPCILVKNRTKPLLILLLLLLLLNNSTKSASQEKLKFSNSWTIKRPLKIQHL